MYTGYRVSLSANYPPMAVPLKLDITTGDKITPKEIEYQFKLLLEERGSSAVVREYRSIMDTIKKSEVMQRQWKNYQKDFEYTMDIAFGDACDVVVELMDEIIEVYK